MNRQEKEWKILELLKLTENLFKEKSFRNPRLNAELLLSRTLNVERINLYTEFEKPLTHTELDLFRSMVKRRLNSEPIQYITGEAYFYGRVFRVNPSVLIPRPETELIVEKAIDVINKYNLLNPRILEIGTGSGCISISLAANVNCVIDAVDNSRNALEIAECNAADLQSKGKIKFLLVNFIDDDIDLENYDLILSNPPYIPENEFSELPEEIRNYEPRTSLTDNGDGLAFYRKIFDLYRHAGRKPHILIEVGDGKRKIVEDLAKKYSISNYIFHKDLLKIDRVLEL